MYKIIKGNKIAVGLIVLGLLIIAKPFVSEYMNVKKQEKLLESYKLVSAQLGKQEKAQASQADSQKQFSDESQSHDVTKVQPQISGTPNKEPFDQEGDKESETRPENEPEKKTPERDIKPIGVLKIDAIEFEQIIMPSASREALDISVGWIPGTGWVGQTSNICIAGHRSKTPGRNFNRLDEVAENDYITIETSDVKKTYLVVNKFIVEPEEVWVVAPFMDKETVTLITCTPMDNPTHRLIIRAVEIMS